MKAPPGAKKHQENPAPAETIPEGARYWGSGERSGWAVASVETKSKAWPLGRSHLTEREKHPPSDMGAPGGSAEDHEWNIRPFSLIYNRPGELLSPPLEESQLAVKIGQIRRRLPAPPRSGFPGTQGIFDEATGGGEKLSQTGQINLMSLQIRLTQREIASFPDKKPGNL